MKSFFKLTLLILIFLSGNLFAREIIVVSYNLQQERAKLVYSILADNLKIPEVLTKIKWQKRSCQKIEEAVLQICIRDNGEMFAPTVDKQVITNAMKIFREQNQEKL